MTSVPQPPSSWQPSTRALHDGIDAHIRATGVPGLHPTEPTVMHDLLGSDAMAAWQEGKEANAFLGETCWSELPTVYARYGTDEARALIRALKALYGAKGAIVTDCGASAVAFAIDALVTPGSHAILCRQIYGKTRAHLEWTAQRVSAQITLVDHLDAATLHAEVRPETTLVMAETYSNPLTRAVDPESVSAAAHALRAERAPDLRVVLDDTVATPWGPARSLLSYDGIDMVVSAGTKAVVGQDRDTLGYLVSNRIGFLNLVMDLQAMRGGTLSWRAAASIVRDLDQADALHATRCASATQVAAFLATRDDVESVLHPSRPDHVDAEVIARAYARPGSLMAFRVRDLDEAGHRHLTDVIAMTKVIRYALSFDGLVTKVNHHTTVSEYFTPAPRLRRQGIDRLVRVAVGTEDPQDLIAALAWALDHHREISVEHVKDWQATRKVELGLS